MKPSTVREVKEESLGEILVLYQVSKVYALSASYLQGPWCTQERPGPIERGFGISSHYV